MMTRLVLVHGRGQGESSSAGLQKQWLDALNRGLETAGRPSVNSSLDVRVPFYGKLLDDLVTSRPAPGEFAARGSAGQVDRFQGELILELAALAGITEDEIAAEAQEEVVARKPENWGWVRAAGRVLSRRVPGLGELLLSQFVSDVHAYLTLAHVTEAVNECVSAQLNATPAVVVGHSLGSIVAYMVLTQRGDGVTVPLFATLGSPLGIDVVKKKLPPPLGQPSGVTRWLNAADKRDPVALYPRLGKRVFPADIDNLDDLHNPKDNPHGIDGYLSDPRVALRIAEGLSF
jgi:hypothetical protein